MTVKETEEVYLRIHSDAEEDNVRGFSAQEENEYIND